MINVLFYSACRVSMEIWVLGGSKIGKVMIELFNDLVPRTCQLFLSLVKGDPKGHAYMGTRFFRLVGHTHIYLSHR